MPLHVNVRHVQYRTSIDEDRTYLSTRDGPIKRRMILINTRGHNLTNRIRIEAQEERHRVPGCRLTIINPMHRGLKPIVRKTLQEIANINHQRARYRPSIEPLVTGRQDLQTAGHILPQKSDALDIGVRANADVDVVIVFLEFIGWCSGIVYIKPVCTGVCGHRIKIVFWHVESEREDTDHLARECEAPLIEFNCYFVEARQMACCIPWEVIVTGQCVRVGDSWIVFGIVAERECLFAIWSSI